MKRKTSSLQLEMAIAYQKTEHSIRTFALPGKNIDSDWTTYGAGPYVLSL
jgi:hypothetical protein